jgi:hypothetical protein
MMDLQFYLLRHKDAVIFHPELGLADDNVKFAVKDSVGKFLMQRTSSIYNGKISQ